jgi:hypothetical protein
MSCRELSAASALLVAHDTVRNVIVHTNGEVLRVTAMHERAGD